ncbi:SDR family NAD(P)-dependent oxidoreductase [Cryptosporangium arvum]|uniref:SDR family NAD(P)-dependent oxidoreductase n=1 Tax=Cryptosporangium arvum TaxID=80871 RepID=UPI0004B4091B|nr:SDR family NAD(P)-dependent oxidoreductase [Cryptosporangium arvum]
MKPILIVGAGPGLGLSMARRFGRDGHPVALISRRPDRHDAYVSSLRADGVTAIAVAADVTDPDRTRAAVATVTDRLGPIGTLYYGPGAADPTAHPVPIDQTEPHHLDEAIRALVRPAVDLTGLVLPGMLDHGAGTLLYVTGLGAVVPLPMLGALAPASAALRTYALTLNAALTDTGVYAGTLVIGGLIERGDIHRHAVATFGPEGLPTLNPDEIADSAADLATTRKTPEKVFNALT